MALTRLVEPADAFLISGLLPLAMLLAGIGVLASEPNRRPFEHLLIPAVLTGGAGAAVHLVSPGLPMVPYLAAFAVLLDRILALEIRLLGQPKGTTDSDRARVLLAAVVTAFIAFTGCRDARPGRPRRARWGGRRRRDPEPGLARRPRDRRRADRAPPRLSPRRAPLRDRRRRRRGPRSPTRSWSRSPPGAIRAIDVPRLLGPAVLTLVFYLWDALHGTAPARRREPRFLWELALLAVLGAVVVAWNLQLRG